MTAPAQEGATCSLPDVPGPPAPESQIPGPRRSLLARLRSLPRRALAAVSSPRRLAALAASLLVLGVAAKLLVPHALAWHHFRTATGLLERYHAREADEHLQTCLKTWPGDVQVLLAAARAARRLGDFERAEGYLRRCGGAEGHDDDVALEWILLRAARGEMDGVEDYCRAVLGRGGPAAALVLEALAYGYSEAYRWDRAEAYLKRWQEQQPDNPQALQFRGVMLSRQNDARGAAAAFRRAIEVDPDFHPPRLNLASVLLELNDPAGALPHLQYLHQCLPDNLTVKLRLGACLEQLDRHAEAAELLDAVLAVHPEHPLALAERGKVARRTGQLEKAEALLIRACDRSGDYAAHYQLYLCLNERGKAAEAREVDKRRKALEADITRIHDILNGQAHLLHRTVSLQHELGARQLRTGSAAEGLRWLQRAVQTDPGYAPAHIELARYYQIVGQPGRAARHRSLAGNTPPPPQPSAPAPRP